MIGNSGFLLFFLSIFSFPLDFRDDPHRLCACNSIFPTKCYVSMKSFSESRVSLDIRPMTVRLKLTFSYVTCEETIIGFIGFVRPRVPLPGLFD
jgi:hypothetical protein